MKILPLFFLSLSFSVLADIEIVGKRRERFYQNQTQTFKPAAASRFSPKTLLKSESGVSSSSRGQSSATGFVPQSLRGHDARLSEIWLGDLLLYDPALSLPLVAEIDLQALGELQLVRGVAPYNVASMSGVGGIYYRLRPLTGRRKTQFGWQWGSPYGLSLWGRQQVQVKGLYSSIYGRAYGSSGRYRYYDAGGNPFGDGGGFRERLNNDQRSYMLMPVLTWEEGAHTFRLVGLGGNKNGGLAGPYGESSSLRFVESSRLISIYYSYYLRPEAQWLPAYAGSQLSYRRDTVVQVGRESLKIGSWQTAWFLTWPLCKLQVEWGDADLKHNRWRHTRQFQRIYFGLRLRPGFFNIETKHGMRWHQDRGPELRESLFHSHSLRLETRGSLRGYAEVATFMRPPSLWEEFGDGASVSASPGLSPEDRRHYGVGLAWRYKPIYLQLGYFYDRVRDRIILVEALASKFKSVNLGYSYLHGVEGTLDWRWRQFSSVSTFNYVQGRYPGFMGVDLAIPRVPDFSFAQVLSQVWGDFTLRGNARYHSAMYRDLANMRRLPGVWLFGAAVDWEHSFWGGNLALGLSVENLSDLQRVSIRSSEQVGYVPYTQVDGYPLPGRSVNLFGNFSF